MRGLRPQDVVFALDELDKRRPNDVVATLISWNDSVTLRSGALAVLPWRGRGLVTVELKDPARLETFGLSEPGRAEVFVEPASDALRASWKGARESLRRGEGLVVRLTLDGPQAGRREFFAPDHPEARECWAEAAPELVEKVEKGKRRRALIYPIGALERKAESLRAGEPTRLPGLILAAGRGRRYASGHKLSVELDGRPVLRHVVDNALAARLDPVVVVLGCGAEKVLKVLEGISDPRLRVVFNPLWEGGKGSSIEVGLRETPASAPGVVALLGDMPMVKPWLIDRVVAEFELSRRLTFPVFGQRRGYPTAFPRSLFGEIRALTGDDTAMEAVRRHWAEAVKIPLPDENTQFDLDTEGDLQLWLGRSA